MSERPDPEVLDCWPFDMSKLPVGTKFTDSQGVMRIVRQHFTDPAGHYTWATQPKKTSRGKRYDRDGRSINSGSSSIVLPETVILPAKADGQEIDLTWLPMGTAFVNGHGWPRKIDSINLSDEYYPLVDHLGRTYTRAGRLVNVSKARRNKDDIVIASIVLPRRLRMPRAGEFDALMAAHSTAPATAKPILHDPHGEVPIPADKPEPQPQPEAEPTKTDLNNIDLNSWEW